MSDTNTYLGRHAVYYDLIYADKPYEAEVRFLLAELKDLGTAPPGTLLDLACGTGRHAAAFSEQGYAVTGVDYNACLVACASERACNGPVKPQFIVGDMRDLQHVDRSFDVVTCLFDSIGYPLSNDGVVAALRTGQRRLGPDGVLVVEFLHAAALQGHVDPTRVRRWATPGGGELLRISETTIDVATGQMEVSYDLLEFRADGSWARERQRQTNRFFAAEEMRALMTLADLRAVRMIPAYAAGGAVDRACYHVLAFARHAPKGLA